MCIRDRCNISPFLFYIIRLCLFLSSHFISFIFCLFHFRLPSHLISFHFLYTCFVSFSFSFFFNFILFHFILVFPFSFGFILFGCIEDVYKRQVYVICNVFVHLICCLVVVSSSVLFTASCGTSSSMVLLF